jgi:hypothetical protein
MAMEVVKKHGVFFAQALLDMKRHNAWSGVVNAYGNLVIWGYEDHMNLLCDLLDADPTNAAYTEDLLIQAGLLDISKQKEFLGNYGGKQLKRLLQDLNSNTQPRLTMISRSFMNNLELEDCKRPQIDKLIGALAPDLAAKLRHWCTIADCVERDDLSRDTLQEMAMTLSELSGLSPAMKDRAVSLLTPILVERVHSDAALKMVINYAGQAMAGSPEQLYAIMFAIVRGRYKKEQDPQIIAPYLRLALRREETIGNHSRISDLIKEMSQEEMDRLNVLAKSWPESTRKEWEAYLQSCGRTITGGRLDKNNGGRGKKRNPVRIFAGPYKTKRPAPGGTSQYDTGAGASDALLYVGILVLVVLLLVAAFLVAEQFLLHPTFR